MVGRTGDNCNQFSAVFQSHSQYKRMFDPLRGINF